MTSKHEIEKAITRWEKFNDPALLMIIFLSIPAVIMATIFSTLGDGTLIKIAIAICFLFFTWLAFKVNSMIKQQIEIFKAQLKELE
jgi:hypothetical protein